MVLAQRDARLNLQWLYVISIFGPMALIFGVSTDTYYSFTFFIGYLTTVSVSHGTHHLNRSYFRLLDS